MKRLAFAESGFSRAEYDRLRVLTSPEAIQDFLDTFPFNHEKNGETLMSPRRVLAARKMHCLEGALVAAAATWIGGGEPFIMNLSSRLGKGDVDHVVALYRRGGLWGAIGKTNHAVIRFRDPVYRTLRELAMSYFHEWFMNSTREKTLECYSQPLDLRQLGTAWITAPDDLRIIDDALSARRHFFLVPNGQWRYVRRADATELKAGQIIEWKKSDPRT